MRPAHHCSASASPTSGRVSRRLVLASAVLAGAPLGIASSAAPVADPLAGPASPRVLLGAPATEDGAAARRAAVENGLFGAFRIEGATWSLEERMEHYGVTGLGIAVIRDSKIDWAAGYGVRDARSGEPVTTRTLFQAASISKPVSAIGAMTLVEDGLLPLDEDVRDYLESWMVPEDDISMSNELTLAHLLSHTGGTTVHGFAGYGSLAEVPTLPQVLDGAPPANSDPVFMSTGSGQMYRYSGGGSTIAQCAMMDVTGEDFADILRARVLEPLGMRDSTFAQPLPTDLWPDHAAGHLESGVRIPGEFHTHPEQFAAGLWTTPSDLARMLIAMQRAWRGEGESLLPTETVRRMLTPVMGGYGLGFSIDQRPSMGSEPYAYFGHGGSNVGFKCFAQAERDGGLGVVIMTNADTGPNVTRELMRAVQYVYGWPGFDAPARERVALDPDTLTACAGRYATDAGDTILVEAVNARDGHVRIRFCPERPRELVPTGPNTFTDPEDGTTIAFGELIGDVFGSVQLDAERGGPEAWRLLDSDEPGPIELLSTGRVDAGLEALRALASEDPRADAVSDGTLNALAVALYGAGDAAAGAAVAAFNVERHPDSANSWDTLAKACELAGDEDGARRAYERTLEALPDDRQLAGFGRLLVERQARGWLAEH